LGNSSTGEGGGIYVGNGTVNVTNGSTLTGNSAATFGGGIYVWYATLTVNGSTLSKNFASTAGGGVYIEPRFASPVTISGSVFSNNTSGPANITDSIFGVWTDGGGNTFS
jgi:predicted outer membrane repeat protein